MNRIGITALVFLSLTSLLPAQILRQTDVVTPPSKTQGSGTVAPVLTYSLQSLEAIGYNLETQATGFGYDTANTNPNLNTAANFGIAFVDSRDGAPLVSETGTDPESWTAHFLFRNFSARVGSAEGLKLVRPAWSAELRGQGFRFGFLSQAGAEITGGSDNNPIISLTGANEVLNLNASPDAAANDTVLTAATSPNSVTYKASATAGEGGLAYLGYVRENLFSVYLTTLAGGSVSSVMDGAEATRNQGWAFALNVSATPLGVASEDNPLALTLKADAVKGFGFTNTTQNPDGNPTGFGLGSQVDLWVADQVVVSPLASFDGRLNDKKSLAHADDFEWQSGGGLQVALGEKTFVYDDWNEKPVDARGSYENSKVQKFAFVQLLGMYSKATDFDVAIKAEEPDGEVGLDPNLGFMAEYRLNDLAKTLTGNKTVWSATGRVSYDLLDHSVVPYLRWYANGNDLASFDKTTAIKVRLGVQVAVVPGFGLEATYMTPQLYDKNATLAKDQGKIELLAVFRFDSTRPEVTRTLTPKTMNFTDWNK